MSTTLYSGLGMHPSLPSFMSLRHFPTCFQNPSRRMSISKRVWFGSRKLIVAATLFGFCAPTMPDWHYVCRLSVRSSLAKLVNVIFWKQMNQKLLARSLIGQLWGSGGQRSRSHKVKHRFVDIILDPSCRVSFLVCFWFVRNAEYFSLF